MKLQEAAAVPVFQKWKSQNKFAFGFIPLSPLMGEKNWEDNGKILLKLITWLKVQDFITINKQGF